MAFFVEGLSDHLAPEATVRRIGECETLEDAIVLAKRRIDDYLAKSWKAGRSATELLADYKVQGVHPYIFRDDGTTINVRGFSHLRYATLRCEEICGGEIEE